VITDHEWLRGDFISTVQKRGAAIIEARGSSSAASAAAAAIDTVVSLRTETAPGDCVSVAVVSSGEYGAPEGLQFGFPIVADGRGNWSVADNFAHDDFAAARIAVTTEELLGERNDVRGLGLIT
jgi:malate dehydrogenase